MELEAAQKLAVKMMQQHGLMQQGWGFRFDNAKSRLGVCNFTHRRITISRYMASYASEEEVTQTMLHEIAHALLPYDVKHGARWKELAASIGYTGERTARNPYTEARNEHYRNRSNVKFVEARRARVGDRLYLLDVGRVLVVQKAARTRYHCSFEGETTIRYTVPMQLAEKHIMA